MSNAKSKETTFTIDTLRDMVDLIDLVRRGKRLKPENTTIVFTAAFYKRYRQRCEQFSMQMARRHPHLKVERCA